MILRVAAATSLGLCTWYAQKHMKPNVHPKVESRFILVKHFKGLAENVSQLENIMTENEFDNLLCRIDEIMNLAITFAPENQWKLARTNEAVIKHMSDLINTKKLTDDDTYRDILFAKDDLLPQLERHLENVLFNHILDRKTRS